MTSKPSVLVVDDTPENIDILVLILQADYTVKVAKSGEVALKIVREDQPDLILLDIMMPEMDGYEVCRRLKEDHTTSHIPVIFITGLGGAADELKGLELGAVDYVTKPISPPIVKARVRTHLALYDQNRELDRKVTLKTHTIQETKQQIIQRLGRAAEYKDDETGTHVVRIGHYASLLARLVGSSEETCTIIMQAATMHDIGKIGIPDSILRKPGKLTVEEYEIMKTHCDIGANIIGDDSSELLKTARIIALTHHEKWDGSGYPNSLMGEDIPRVGRIVALADVFDALTSERPYKEAWSIEKTLEFLHQQSGKHFEPELVRLFTSNMDEVLEVFKKNQTLD